MQRQWHAQRLISLLAWCLAIPGLLVGLLWVKSFLRSDTICWDRDGSRDANGWRTQWAVQSRRGVIVIGRFFYSPAASSWSAGPLKSEAQGTIIYRARAQPLDWIGPDATAWGWLGFDYRHTYSNTWAKNELTIMSLPHGAIALPLMIWPGIYWRRAFQLRQRRKLGLCANCGYDLRAMSSDRCPECGTKVNGPPSSPSLAGRG